MTKEESLIVAPAMGRPTPPPVARLVPWLVGMYALLIVIGAIVSSGAILRWFDWPVVERAVAGSIAIGVGASALHYLRRLYKALFVADLMDAATGNVQTAAAIYFFTRPLYAVMFSLLTVVGLMAGFLAISGPVRPTEGLIYLSMFLSFFAGFTGGALIDTLEPFGQDLMGRLFPSSAGQSRRSRTEG